MKTQAIKALADLKSGGSRSWLVVFALVLGLWGVGTIAVSYRILSPDLKQNFQSTRAPHALVTLDQPWSVDLSSLGSRIEAAEYRDFALLRVEISPQRWIPLYLYGVQDFGDLKVARFQPQEGSYPPAPGTLVIERDVRNISSLRTGATMKVRSGDRNLSLEISGVVFDPAQAPSTQDHFVYAYTDQSTWTSLTGQSSGRRLALRFPGADSAEAVRSALAEISFPPLAQIQIPPFEEHPHQWQMDLLLGIIGTVGILAFLISSVLVSQVIGALMASQVRQIGILKALGATPFQVARLYSLNLLFYALLSGALALPLAVLSGQAFAGFVAKTLNFDILTPAVPGDTWILLIAAALGLPFLFAGPRLFRAAGLTIREALVDLGIQAPENSFSWGPRALRNLMRRPGRQLITMTATVLGVAIFSTGFNMRESLAEFLAATREATRFDLQVALLKPEAPEALLSLTEGLTGLEAQELWSGGRGELQSALVQTDSGLGVVALPADSRLFQPQLRAGRWIRRSPSPEVALNQVGHEALGSPALGTQLELPVGGVLHRATLVGILEEIDRAKIYVDQAVWTSWRNQEARVNTLVLKARDSTFEGIQTLKGQIEARIEASSLHVLFVMSQAERTKIIADHLDIVLAVFLLLSFLVLGVSALGQAAAAAITVQERTREIGVLRAIGAGPRSITRLFVAEGLWGTLGSLSLGLALSLPLSQVGAAFFGVLMLGKDAALRFAWNPLGTIITIAVTVLFSWLAARLPSGAALGVSTREALGYE